MTQIVEYDTIRQYQNIVGKDKMRKLWQEFINECAARLNDVDIKTKDEQRLIFHSLRSSSLVFGMRILSDFCHQMEEKIVSGNRLSEEDIKQSRKLMRKSLDAVNEYMQSSCLKYENKKMPLYTKEIYGDFYNNKRLVKIFDSSLFRNITSLWQNHKLIDAGLKEINPGDRVLQFGCTLGAQMEKTASRVGAYGQYDVLDVSSIQINRCKKKYGNLYMQMKYIQQNANKPVRDNYDVVLVYMLLHEVPHIQKSKILKAALDSVKEGGKLVVIDYHEPVKWHPLRYVVRMFNRLLQPFAEILWDREIPTFIKDKSSYIFRRALYFGGMYQKVVIDKKFSQREGQ